MMNVKNMEVGLSPPYGDGMIEQAEHEIQGTFSPPYGDGILNISQNHRKTEEPEARKCSLYCNDVLLALKRNGHKFIQPALCAGRFHGMMLIMDLIKRECCPVLKTYITTVPLQGKLDPMLYQRERADAPTATCFPDRAGDAGYP